MAATYLLRSVRIRIEWSGEAYSECLLDLRSRLEQLRTVNLASRTALQDPMIQIGVLSGSKWRAKKSASSGEELMIQTLTDETFAKVCVDSGAGESVCPVDAFPSYETKKTAKPGMTCTAAGGQALVNVGEKRPEFKTNGVDVWMAFQATTKVQKPLAAATRITEKGNRIVLDDADSESCIMNKKSGAKIPLTIENGVYMMQMLVKPAAPFQGQARF